MPREAPMIKTLDDIPTPISWLAPWRHAAAIVPQRPGGGRPMRSVSGAHAGHAAGRLRGPIEQGAEAPDAWGGIQPWPLSCNKLLTLVVMMSTAGPLAPWGRITSALRLVGSMNCLCMGRTVSRY